MLPAVLDRHRTNLCTNPVAATATTGWTNTSLTLFERVTSLPTLTGLPEGLTTGFHCTGNANADRATFPFAVVSGQPMLWVSVYIYVGTAPSGGVQGSVRKADGTTSVGTPGASISTTSQWFRKSFGIEADETGTWTLDIRQSGTGTPEWWFTAALLDERSSALRPYFAETTPVHINAF